MGDPPPPFLQTEDLRRIKVLATFFLPARSKSHSQQKVRRVQAALVPGGFGPQDREERDGRGS